MVKWKIMRRDENGKKKKRKEKRAERERGEEGDKNKNTGRKKRTDRRTHVHTLRRWKENDKKEKKKTYSLHDAGTSDSLKGRSGDPSQCTKV